MAAIENEQHVTEPVGDAPEDPVAPVTVPGDVPGPPAPSATPAPAPERARGGCRAGCVSSVVALIVASIFGFLAGVGGARLVVDGTFFDSPVAATRVTVVGDTTEEPVAAVAAVGIPSVVNIDVTSESVAEPDEMMPEGHPGVPSMGNGSGVAWTEAPDGGTYILTNDHVVAQADEIRVTDADGRRYDGELVGTDANTDIAVVLVGGEIPLIDMGDSDELLVGDMVVAIGSPFGLMQSVTAGVVSAVGRSLPTGEEGVYPLVDVIQTDAAINPGNSGGALLDREGRLVGINTAIFSSTGTNDGIGFAVPVGIATRVAEEIVETGDAQAPFLGIVGQTITETLAGEQDLPVEQGALVVEVTEGTGAEEAGIGPGDIIVGYDDEPVRSMDDLILVVRRTAVGDEAVLDVYRPSNGDYERLKVTIVVGDKPDTLQLPDESE